MTFHLILNLDKLLDKDVAYILRIEVFETIRRLKLTVNCV